MKYNILFKRQFESIIILCIIFLQTTANAQESEVPETETVMKIQEYTTPIHIHSVVRPSSDSDDVLLSAKGIIWQQYLNYGYPENKKLVNSNKEEDKATVRSEIQANLQKPENSFKVYTINGVDTLFKQKMSEILNTSPENFSEIKKKFDAIDITIDDNGTLDKKITQVKADVLGAINDKKFLDDQQMNALKAAIKEELRTDLEFRNELKQELLKDNNFKQAITSELINNQSFVNLIKGQTIGQ